MNKLVFLKYFTCHMSTIRKPILWSFSPPARTFGANYIWIWGVGHQCSMIFDIRSYYFYTRSTWDSKWKSVGEESIQTIIDKCDVRYSTLIFSIRSTSWAGPKSIFLVKSRYPEPQHHNFLSTRKDTHHTAPYTGNTLMHRRFRGNSEIWSA